MQVNDVPVAGQLFRSLSRRLLVCIKKHMRKNRCMALLIGLTVGCTAPEAPQGGVQSVLFTGKGTNQPLVVGFGGSEGGNAWATPRWKKTRDLFVDSGYAFLAIGYFGMEGTPAELDRIALEGIHQAIVNAQQNPAVAPNRVALIGGSKGAELALLMGSIYPDVSCVVSMVGSHAVFPALTIGASTSSWTYKGEEVSYVPATWRSLLPALTGNLRRSFELMMEDSAAVERALIPVEKIHGPVLCVSASADEMWPSTEMSTAVMQRLEASQFQYAHQHIIVPGGHNEPLDTFPDILTFLLEHYPVDKDD
jgi:dienelactone hydrolase